MKLPKNVVDEDKKLQAAGASLGQLRWHWTKDESNPKRITIRQYAAAVGVSEQTVGNYVKAWEAWGPVRARYSWNEHLDRTRHSDDQEAVIAAVSEEEGTSFVTTRVTRKKLVKKTKAKAEARAKRNKTSVKEEAAAAARDVVGAEKAKKAKREQKAQRRHLRYAELDSKIDTVREELRDIRTLLTEVDFDADDLTDFGAGLVGVRSILNDCLALTGQVDLDAEFQEVN